MSHKLNDMTYLSQPTLTKTHLYFLSEDDLWKVPLEGSSIAQRLTAGLGALSAPCASPDGKWIAVGSEEEGHTEIYILPADGGESKRITYLGGSATPVAWLNQDTLIFKSNFRHAHRMQEFFKVGLAGGIPDALNLGEGTSLSYGESGIAIERNMHRPDPAHWKRYRGGTMGQLWVGKSLEANFTKLSDLPGNLSRPLWLNERLFYLSDESGLSRIYSCDSAGKDKRAHASEFKSDFYFRHLVTNGEMLAFQSGGDLFFYDPKTDQIKKPEIKVVSDVSKKKRKVVAASAGFQSYSLQPQGERLLIEVRGKILQLSHWSGAVSQLGSEYAVRYKCADWLNDGKRVVLIADNGLSEQLELFSMHGEFIKVVEVKSLSESLGRVGRVIASPKKDEVILSNHRNELIWIDLQTGEAKVIFANKYQLMEDFSFSPCGRYVAFSESFTRNKSRISIFDIEKKSLHPVTIPLLDDFSPRFDPDGKYLFFLSKRAFNPIYDDIFFDMGFAKGSLPFLVVLNKNEMSPFIRESTLPEKLGKPSKPSEPDAEKKCAIDFDGIENRVLQFPVQEAKYTKIIGVGSKVLWSYSPVEGAIDSSPTSSANASGKECLDCFDFSTGKFESFGAGVTSFEVRAESNLRILRRGNSLQLAKASEKSDDVASKAEASPKSGAVDLSRAQVMIEPREEWIHMFKDAWRMQKEFFWRADLGGLDWDAVYKRYQPLLEKINSRREFSDLIWEVIGELGTSHAYEQGGDYRKVPVYAVGGFGAHFCWNFNEKGYEILELLKGDSWNPNSSSPLLSPGVNLLKGDLLLELGHQKLNEEITPTMAALGLAGKEVYLKVKRQKTGDIENVLVRLLRNEQSLRYREWVEGKRAEVKKRSHGKLGYVHIPNMSGVGFAEFYRNFLQELECEGLVIDVRYNGGGNVSQLILDRLSRVPIGRSESRWFGTRSVPFETPQKVLVAVANEFAGSDGDIFTHTFKMKKLGKLIGTRTWGGVVGIWPRNKMIDGGHTTQPEFAFWFEDVGHKIENYGTVPDVTVEFPPEAWRNGSDPQLEFAVNEALKSLS